MPLKELYNRKVLYKFLPRPKPRFHRQEKMDHKGWSQVYPFIKRLLLAQGFQPPPVFGFNSHKTPWHFLIFRWWNWGSEKRIVKLGFQTPKVRLCHHCTTTRHTKIGSTRLLSGRLNLIFSSKAKTPASLRFDANCKTVFFLLQYCRINLSFWPHSGKSSWREE